MTDNTPMTPENPGREDVLPEDADFEEASLELDDPEMIALLEKLASPDAAQEQKVVLPQALEEAKGYAGPIQGFIREDSGYHVILGWEGQRMPEAMGAQEIGAVCRDEAEAEALAAGAAAPLILGLRNGDGALAFRLCRPGLPALPLNAEIYTLRQDAFSRNSGLLETDWMDGKCAIISGVGSVGSLAALQLARSGVGRFVLVDTDCMEIHNVCRHQCSLKDVGRYKVDAVAERILQINPNAQIRTWRRRIQDVPREAYEDWALPNQAIFIGTCDNRVGNAYACDAAKELRLPCVTLGFRDRAWAGEIFVYLPQRKDICYRCAFRTQIEESIAEERRNHLYLDDARKGDVQIVPGLDVDIEYGVSLLDKVVLDILNLGNKAYTYRLLPKMGQFNYFSGTMDRSEGEFWAKILPDPLSMTPIRLLPELRRCESCLERRP